MQRSIFVKDSLDYLNGLLEDGWKVVSNAPMGGVSNNAGNFTTANEWRSLVVLEKDDEPAGD